MYMYLLRDLLKRIFLKTPKITRQAQLQNSNLTNDNSSVIAINHFQCHFCFRFASKCSVLKQKCSVLDDNFRCLEYVSSAERQLQIVYHLDNFLEVFPRVNSRSSFNNFVCMLFPCVVTAEFSVEKFKRMRTFTVALPFSILQPFEAKTGNLSRFIG